tara:strand:+ start:405 stop:971 length:567 start_codon:yes stop_codon:yes gene_type:complete
MSNILFLGYSENKIIDFLNKENRIVVHNQKVDEKFIREFDYIISYGYNHLFKKNIIDSSKNGIINLHISYLPYNRGAHPNFWSFFEDTKKGVTIHLIDQGIDTGDILFQKEVFFDTKEDTLEKTYFRLRHEIEVLFIENWNNIVNKNYKKIKQESLGSFHIKKNLEKFNLVNGWKTKIKNINKEKLIS